MQAPQPIVGVGARQTIATYADYAEAQAAVDYLSDQKFPVEHTAIVGEGLRIVEQVTGRLSYGRAALNGALTGGLVGAFIGLFFGLFDLVDPLVSGLTLALYGLILGAIAGVVLGLAGYAFSGGKRDFTSISGMDAERYAIMVDAEVAGEAGRLLTGFAARRGGSVA